ncbi:hypothetical protein JXI42_01950 [bacterium]|nr:hypothetical protein [bacterium]
MREIIKLKITFSILTLFSLVAGVFIFQDYAIGVGLSVSPGTILIQDFPVGEFYDFSEQKNYDIRISNEAETPHTYALAAEKPSNSQSSATGFYDFAHPEWFYFEVETIFVDALENESVGIFMDIPEADGWYNHHWLLGISVMPLPGELQGGTISLGAYLLFRFETEPKEGVVPTLAENEMVLVPSTIVFDDVEPGELYQKKVKLYHPFQIEKKCDIYPLDPSSEVAKWTILISKGHSRLQNHDWVVYDSTVNLQPNQPCDLDIYLQTPPGNVRPTEEILIFEAFNIDKKAFLRIKTNFKEKE